MESELEFGFALAHVLVSAPVATPAPALGFANQTPAFGLNDCVFHEKRSFQAVTRSILFFHMKSRQKIEHSQQFLCTRFTPFLDCTHAILTYGRISFGTIWVNGTIWDQV